MTKSTSWPRVPLGELCNIVIGRTPARAEPRYWGAGHYWLSIGDMGQGRDLVKTRETVTDAAARECAGRLVEPGTLVMSFKLSLGKVGIVRAPMYTNEAIAALPVKDLRIVTVEYLYHALRSIDVKHGSDRAAKGRTLNKDKIAALLLPLPPLQEQRRIAAILDKANAIRQKRQRTIQLVDELLSSAFLEMFGDPVGNPRAWPTRKIGDIALVTTGSTPSRRRLEYYGEDIEWIKSDNINTPEHIVTRAKEGLSAIGLRVGRIAEAGSTLMTCIAGSPGCIGNVALTDRRVAFNQQINAITPGESLDSAFLYVELLLSKPLIQSVSTDSMKGMVSKGRLIRVRLPLPPLDLQRKFSRWFARFLEWRHRLSRASRWVEELLGSLSPEVFGVRAK